MSNLSIRATGLLAILQKNQELMLDAETLSSNFNESPQYIEHTLKELVSAGCIDIDNNCIRLVSPLDLVISNKTLAERIFSLYGEARTYKVIAWFLAQLDKTFDLDSELSERVSMEYKAGAVVQFWTDYHIDQAMKRALVDKSIGNVTMNDLLDLLRKRDKGELVWQK